MSTIEQEEIHSTPPDPLDNKATNNKKAVFLETPAKRLPALSVHALPPTVASTGQTSAGTRPSLTLDQQLGWDDYDF